MPSLQRADIKTVKAAISSPLVEHLLTLQPSLHLRSLNENACLADIVEAVQELERAISSDSGVTSRLLLYYNRLVGYILSLSGPQAHLPSPSPSLARQ